MQTRYDNEQLFFEYIKSYALMSFIFYIFFFSEIDSISLISYTHLYLLFIFSNRIEVNWIELT